MKTTIEIEMSRPKRAALTNSGGFVTRRKSDPLVTMCWRGCRDTVAGWGRFKGHRLATLKLSTHPFPGCVRHALDDVAVSSLRVKLGAVFDTAASPPRWEGLNRPVYWKLTKVKNT